MPKVKKLLQIQVGMARDTDEVFDIHVNKTLGRQLRKMATDGVLQISPEQLFAPIASGALDQGIVLENVKLPDPPQSILDIAKSIIYGDREKAYGNPRFNLDTIAQMWNVYLNRKFPEMVDLSGPFNITAEDVAQLMILLKMARLIHNPTHKDSLVDQAGYAALQDRIQTP